MIPDNACFERGRRKDRQSSLFLIIFGLALTVLMPLLIQWNHVFLSYFSGKLYDEFLALRKQKEPSGQIVIIDIDEKSLQNHGQWPWPRYKIAAIIDALDQAGVAAIGLDIIFAENERASRLNPAKSLQNNLVDARRFADQAVSDNDSLLAAAIARSPTVLGYQFHFDAKTVVRDCQLHPLLTTGGSATASAGDFSLQARHATCNIEALVEGAKRSGFLNTATERDGILRQASMIIAHENRFYPSLGLAVVMQAKGLDYISLNRDFDNFILRLGKTNVPLTPEGGMWINYHQSESAFTYVSASEVLAGTAPVALLKGKIVLLGTTAVGLKELRPTPLDPMFPGIEVHATVADNLLTGDVLFRPSYAPALELFAAIGCGALFLFALLRAGAWRSLTGLLAGVIFLFYSSFSLFSIRGIYLSPILPLSVLVCNFSLVNLVKFRQKENLAKRQVEELATAQASIIEGMASLTECRHQETGWHITRTQEYVGILARLLQNDKVYGEHVSDELVDLLYRTAPLHDIGKVGVPDHILLKEDELTAKEYEKIMEHPVIGRDIIVSIGKKMGSHSFLQVALDLIYTHHEKWNGSGYPQGLKGEEIPLAGRIMAIVDMYDALTSKRVYKKILSHEEALALMKQHARESFDPGIFFVFMANHEVFRQAAARFSNISIS